MDRQHVRIQRQKKFVCRICGKTATRSRTFERAIDSFDRTAAGFVKTYYEVFVDVRNEADLWQPDAHAACEAAEQARLWTEKAEENG